MGIGSSILAGVAISRLTKNMDGESDESATQTEETKTMPKETPDQTVPVRESGDKMDQLIATQQRTNPSPESVDGYDSASITLQPGQSVILSTTPRSGLNLKVQKVYFDRKDNFKYTFLVDGEQFGGSNSNQIEFQAPRTVQQGGKVVAIATNESSVETTLDWEITAWGEPA